jgi:glycerophosphoryl diester phosphodiesterase
VYWFSTGLPLILGHRGASAHAPECTLAAFELALDQGADGIEFDVQLSADGWPVVIHDSHVNRTTNGDGPVAKLTLAQLRALDAGEGQKVPTLIEVFETFGARMLYNVEIKQSGWRSRGTEAIVADCIRTHGLEKHSIVSSFNPLSVRRARHHLSPITLIIRW